MITLSTRRQDGSGSLLMILGIPLCVVFFMGFIDEGFYDLRWMQEPGNWVIFGLYWLAMILGEFGVSLLLPSTWPTRQKLWLIIGLGIPLGILLMLAFLATVTGFAF